jgi:Ca2+-binding EF-hand superfamily protein
MCTAMRRVIKQVEELRRRRKFLATRLEGLFLKAFNLCDVNNDGGVSMEECVVLDKQIAEVTGNLHTFIENDSRRLWKSMDANGDGEVSAKEYVQHMMGTIPIDQHEVRTSTTARILVVLKLIRFSTNLELSLSWLSFAQAAGDILVQTLTDVATLRRERRGYRAQLVELLRDAFELCDEDGSGEVDPDECIKLDKEIAAVSGRDFDEEGTKKVRLLTCNDL